MKSISFIKRPRQNQKKNCTGIRLVHILDSDRSFRLTHF